MSDVTGKLDKLLASIIDDFNSYTDEYKADCRQKTKQFLTTLIKESESLETLLSKVEGL